MSKSRYSWSFVGLFASSLICGCTNAKMVTTPQPASGQAVPTVTPVIVPTMTPGEIVSAQDPNLTVRDIKDVPARMGRAVVGAVTNRGTREYSVVNITIDFLDAHGKIIGSSRDSVQEMRPGDVWNFRANNTSDSVKSKVAELRGY